MKKSSYIKTLSLIMIFLLMFTQSVVYAIDVEIEDPTPDLEAPQLNQISTSSQTLTPTTPVKITANITDDLSGVKNAVIYYKKPSGTTRSYTFVYNTATKLFEATISVGTVDEPGEWKVSSVYLNDNKDNSISIGQSQFDFSLLNLQVSGVTLPEVPIEPTDKEPPVLHDISVESLQVKSGQSIKVTADVTDNESGVRSVTVYYKKPSGRQFSISLTENATTGKFVGSKTINQYEELGEWKIDYVYLSDKVSNSVNIKTYKDHNNAPKNFDHCTVEIIGTTPDLQAPSLDDLAIELKQISSILANVILTAKVTDELSGVYSVSGSYRKPSGKTFTLNFYRSGDYFIATIPIDKYDELGRWELKYISATDYMSNSMTIHAKNEEKFFNGFDIMVNGKITISPGFPFSIDLVNSLTLQSGESFQLQPYLNYTDKTKQDITSDRLTEYTSSNPELVNVSKTGLISIPSGAVSGYAIVGVAYGDIVKNVTVKVNGGSENAYLKITPLIKTMSAGQQEQIQVIEIKNGISTDVTNSISGIKYTSINSLLASVSADGNIQIEQGVEKGTAIIKVSYGSLSGEVKINITKPSVKSLVISPSEESLSLTNNKLQLIVKAFMSDGTTKDVTNSSQGTIYKSSNAAIAKVSADGFITIPSNAKSGEVIISATNNYLTVKTVLKVEGNPELVSLNLDSIPKEMNIGKEQNVVIQSEWSDGTKKELKLKDAIVVSSRPDRVSITPEGVISALSAGTSNIAITYEGKTFNTTVKVLPPPTIVNFYLENPVISQMKIGEEITIPKLKAEWSNGEISDINVNEVIFSSSRSDRVSVTDSGILKALSSGSSTIEIKYSGKIINFSIKVEVAPTLSSIFLETDIPAQMKIGEEYTIGTLKAKWSNGEETVLDKALVSYSSSRPDRISITADGKLKALSTGASNIDIFYEGKNIRVAVKCEPGPTLMSIYLVSSLPATMNVGEEKAIGIVKAKWSNGEETVIESEKLQFASSRPDRISITGDGKLEALTTGASTIDIMYEGKLISYTVKVELGPTILSINLVSSPPASMKIGETIFIGTVKAKLSNGQERIIDSAGLSFTSSRPDRIFVSGDGKLEALSIGASNININYGGKTISLSIKVVSN